MSATLADKRERRDRTVAGPRLPGWRDRIVLAGCCLVAVALAGCGAASTGPGPGTGRIRVVAAENEYGDVAAQIGGRYVYVASIESNPNTDPHDYELSPGVASEVSSAQVVVQNGAGYDGFMNRLESASPSRARKVVVAQQLLGLPATIANPHLWYRPGTMAAVAAALAADFSAIEPAHRAYFEAASRRFVLSLAPWVRAIAAFKAAHPNTPVAVTEPVADYLLEAAGADIRTPFAFQASVMNGVDPAPQYVALEARLIRDRQVKVFVYNQQVTDALTQSFVADARQAGVPVVGVYETMPEPGYDYQTWMFAEIQAIDRAVTDRTSTVRL